MKASELAKQLKPYIIKWINDAQGGGGGATAGTGGGNFAPTPHSMSSYHHNGQLPHSSTWMSGLTNDTHTQYAAADGQGTRSAYQAERLNKTVFAGSGITGGGLMTADRTLTLRTPGINLAASSTNVVNTNGHTHAVDSKSDVSATTTEDLLKSTASGGLTLKTLDVMGAVDILGGDLTVGSGMTLFVDESGNNVGIAGAPDPQFALDVNGPFHADSIYGPLGRLLKDCVFLAHFDGPPGPNDWSGTPQTVQGLLPTSSSALVYQSAKYGKGLIVSFAASNLFANPVFDNATTWNAQWNTGADIAVVQNVDKNFVYSGSNSSKVTRTGSGANRVYYDAITVGTTGSYMLTAYVKRFDSASIGSGDLNLYYGATITSSYAAIGDGWYLLSASVAGSTISVATGVAIVAMNTDYYIGGAQLESHATKAYPTPLAHGDMIVGHSWDGTSGSSQTSRIATRLIYDGISMPQTWSLGFWYQPWAAMSEYVTTHWLMCWADDANNLSALYISSGGSVIGRWTDNGTNVNVSLGSDFNRGQKYHIAMTYDGSTMRFYVDGTFAGSGTASPHATSPSTLGVGSYYTGINPPIGIIDDFYATKTVQSEDDIGAIVDSEVPVAAEVGKTSWYSGGLAPVWVDSDGLWMRDHTGLEVMGWSAVDNKSWGGVTLDMGDNLVGRYGSGSGGWMRWDRSAGQLKLGYSNACSLAFDGSGACIVGKLQMPGASAAIAVGTTPPTASNAGTGIWIDRGGLTSLSANASQLKINATNGKFVAGSDTVTIDSNGITIVGIDKMRFYTPSASTTGNITTMTMVYPAENFEIRTSCGMKISGSTEFINSSVRFGIGAPLLIEDDGSRIYDSNSDSHAIGFFVPRATRLSSTSWDGDARSSSPKTLVDLSAVFGAPPNIKAVLVQLAIRDSTSATTDCQIILSPNNSTTQDQALSCHGLANDSWARGQLIVPCDSNGDIYYQFVAGGALTLDVHMYITGYWI